MSPMKNLVELAAQGYIIVIIIAAVISWFRIGGENQIVVGIQRATDPLFGLIRGTADKYVPSVNELPVDISPLLAILLVHVAKYVLYIIL